MVTVKDPSDLASVLERIRQRAERDPVFAESLSALVVPAATDPFNDDGVSGEERAQVRAMNQQRQAEQLERLRARSLPTPDVVELLPTVSDRKGVDRRRKRGTLLGIRHGNQVLHPRWQFDIAGRKTWDGLARVLAALRAVSEDPVVQDAVAVNPHPDAGGTSVTEVLAAGEVERAVELIGLAGDQS